MDNQYPLIIGNWKLNGESSTFRQAYINELKTLFQAPLDKINIAICPASIYINELAQDLSSLNIKVGSQNVNAFQTGAYTGETSAIMLKALGCHLSIIGHSERREFFAESNADCNNKIKQLHKQEMLPVLCIGESQNERESKTTNEVLKKQLSESLADIKVTAETPLCVAQRSLTFLQIQMNLIFLLRRNRPPSELASPSAASSKLPVKFRL